jgi:hypothetical protein
VYFKTLKGEDIMIKINPKPETESPKKIIVDPRFTKAFLENVRTYFK